MTGQFTKYNAAITLVLVSAALFIKHYTTLFSVHVLWPALTPVYFAVLTHIIYKLAVTGLRSSSAGVSQMALLGGMGIRMMFSLLFITLYLALSAEKDIFFIGYFLTTYLLYTMFEIYLLVINLRPGLKK